jgi:hypothetical protein
MYGLYSIAMQLLRMSVVSDPLERYKHKDKGRTSSTASEGRCGCCPVCQAFVYVELSSPDGIASCPRCGRRIRSLDPLGPAESE